MTADTAPPPGDEPEWVMGPHVDYSKWSNNLLFTHKQAISDRLVEMGEPRPLLSGVNPVSEEAKDLHSQYFACQYVLYKRGLKDEG